MIYVDVYTFFLMYAFTWSGVVDGLHTEIRFHYLMPVSFRTPLHVKFVTPPHLAEKVRISSASSPLDSFSCLYILPRRFPSSLSLTWLRLGMCYRRGVLDQSPNSTVHSTLQQKRKEKRKLCGGTIWCFHPHGLMTNDFVCLVLLITLPIFDYSYFFKFQNIFNFMFVVWIKD